MTSSGIFLKSKSNVMNWSRRKGTDGKCEEKDSRQRMLWLLPCFGFGTFPRDLWQILWASVCVCVYLCVCVCVCVCEHARFIFLLYPQVSSDLLPHMSVSQQEADKWSYKPDSLQKNESAQSRLLCNDILAEDKRAAVLNPNVDYTQQPQKSAAK